MILWDVAERRQLAALPMNTELATSVAFSPDGSILATGGLPSNGKAGKVILWDVAARTQLATLEGLVGFSVAFRPDGLQLATGGFDGSVLLWDVAGRSQQATLSGLDGPILTVTFSPDGKTLAAASEGVFTGGVMLWDVDGRLKSDGPFSGERSVGFSPDGKVLAFQHANKLVLRDIAKAEDIRLTGHGDRLREVAFSPDGRTIASGAADRKVILWDAGDRLQPGRTFDQAGLTNNVSFSADGRTLVSLEAPKPYAVKLWDVDSGTVRAQLPVDEADGGVFFSPDGRRIVVGHTSRRVLAVWNVDTRTQEGTLSAEQPILVSSFSPDGRTLATLYQDGVVGLWNIDSRLEEGRLSDPDGLTDVAFSPDGRTLASSDRNNRVTLWDVASRSKSGVLTGHTGTVRQVSFSDGNTLASVGDDDRVILWDVVSRTQRATLPAEQVSTFGLSPGGRLLAMEVPSKGIALWDLDSRIELGRFASAGNSGNISGFSPDGRVLATTGVGGIFLWDVALDTWLGRLCNIIGRELTAEEWALYLPGQARERSCA